MQRNCGILAYDKLVGELNGRANTISMNTLKELALDNGFLLFPMKVPLSDVDKIVFPCIVYTKHHFEMWNEFKPHPYVLERGFIYVLSHEPVTDCVMTVEEARDIRGADMGMGGAAGGGHAPAYSGGMAINPPSGSQVAQASNWGWSMPSYSAPIMTQSP